MAISSAVHRRILVCICVVVYVVTRELNITLGPPGTGKTTAMLNKIEAFLNMGIPPEKIAFVSYTKKSVSEAAERAAERFGFSHKRFRNFRTIHSTCYQGLGITRKEVMDKADYKQLGELLGIPFRGFRDASEGISLGEITGDYMLQLINLANARTVDLRTVWKEIDQNLDWYKLKLLDDTLRQYKQDTGKLDFDDMLRNYLVVKPSVDVTAAIIDEAQDLSNAQWDVAKTAFRAAKYIDIAGDDDQAIYAWSGANVERFMAIKGNTTVLQQSYRIPHTVHAVAQRIIKQVSVRLPKVFAARDEGGSVQYATQADAIDFANGETWMLLARNTFFLQEFQDSCDIRGVPYIMRGVSSVDPEHVRAIVLWERSRKGQEMDDDDAQFVRGYAIGATKDQFWFDALKKIPLQKREYYLSALRNGHRLQDAPKIIINTIHGVKGGEADNVALMTDMTSRSYESMNLNADNEHRVFYVGATRARKNLHIIQPQTVRGYLI